MTTLTGCSNTRPVELHPITGTDLIRVSEGQTFKAPKNGFYISNEYYLQMFKSVKQSEN